MKVTEQVKAKVLQGIRADFEAKKGNTPRYTQSRHAVLLGINSSVYSRLVKGSETDRVLSEGEWVRLAKQLRLNIESLGDLHPAQTKTYKYIRRQLMECMQSGLCGIYCDDSSLGKTYTAKDFAAAYPNVAYVSCSGVKTWSKLIKAIAAAFGIQVSGSLFQIRQQVIDGILALENPLIILDEAGDLNDAAILELKGLWNEIEFMCGWYLMGANGLRKKFENKVIWNKVGYEELFNRVGGKYQSLTGTLSPGGKEVFKRAQIVEILTANLPAGVAPEEIERMASACEFNARRCRTEIIKFHKKAA